MELIPIILDAVEEPAGETRSAGGWRGFKDDLGLQDDVPVHPGAEDPETGNAGASPRVPSPRERR